MGQNEKRQNDIFVYEKLEGVYKWVNTLRNFRLTRSVAASFEISNLSDGE